MTRQAASLITDVREGGRTGLCMPSGSALSAGMPRPSYALKEMVFLIGFMGAGKTSLARKLARQCGSASIDLDRYIERVIDCGIPAFFAREGEAAFRQVEAQVLSDLSKGDPAFVSCGGGIVGGSENRRILSSSGFTVYMKVSPDEAMARISNPSNRPLMTDAQSFRELARQREPLYASVADVVVDTSGHTSQTISRKVKRLLLDKGILLPKNE